jgi:Protein of unknown function (DUF2853)
MSQFEELMDKYKSEMKEMSMSFDEALLESVAKGLGPSIYNNDSSKVSSSDDEELERVDKNYLQGKLGLAASPSNMDAIKEVANQFGSSNKNKYRVIFYYLLCVKFGKESVYA